MKDHDDKQPTHQATPAAECRLSSLDPAAWPPEDAQALNGMITTAARKASEIQIIRKLQTTVEGLDLILQAIAQNHPDPQTRPRKWRDTLGMLGHATATARAALEILQNT